MKSRRSIPWNIAFASSALLTAWMAPSATAAPRQFLVILANSPKQYPNPARDPAGQPADGLPNPELIRRQYFDNDPNNDLGSFAEFWREMSYGDVTISGDVTDWIDLPWAIQPPLVSAARDNPGGNPPVGDNLSDATFRNSPANFLDLDRSTRYEYGNSEVYNFSQATTGIDFDGDPDGDDNGPFFVSTGGFHTTALGFPVWKPGERFVDMDEDGRWDALDEAQNAMDLFINGTPVRTPDGRPDLIGAWVDLNANGIPENDADCVYLSDSDNDGNPNCCPGGPFTSSCERFPAFGACRPTSWTGPDDRAIIDCNGNLIPDDDDITFGISLDRGPLTENNGQCEPGPGDGIPDECQRIDAELDCIDAECEPDTTDVCCLQGRPACAFFEAGLFDPEPRCEFVDFNANENPDLVEPYENFMRRWDPCLFDPDVSAPNAPPEQRGHWIKVYDPNSPNAALENFCVSPEYSVRYDDPSYILNNYPAVPTDQDKLVREAQLRPIFGEHDPFGKISDRRDCFCLRSPSDGQPGPCETVTPRLLDGTPLPQVDLACLAGYHSEFNPPDSFDNVVANNGPGDTIVASSKMIAVGGRGLEAEFIDPVTAKPGEGTYDDNEIGAHWYEQAWEDRYGQLCENPEARDNASAPPFITCVAPPWTRDLNDDGRTHEIVPFPDANAATYNADVNRRYFHANRGGLHGDGTGWVGCGGLDRSILFETGTGLGVGFDVTCDAPIMPEEVNGPSEVAVFYDGYVEHDDLPSSKYHIAGDQRLGEVTSPFSNEIWGQDRGPHTPFSPPDPDNFIAPGGPYATHVHGNLGRDAGNVLLMELLTWRTTPPFNNGIAWLSSTVGAVFHPYAVAGDEFNFVLKGFRDYNLDGLIDQGESRYAGSENYQSDSDVNSVNNGIASRYPFHRDRMMEDTIAVVDDLVDFDDFVDRVSLERITCPSPPDFGVCAPWPLRDQSVLQTCEPVFADGILSGIVLLPPGAHADGDFNRAPSFIPIHNSDNDNAAKKLPLDRNPNTHATVSWNLFFFDLVFSLGVEGEQTVPATDFQTAFSAHEYLHSWEGYPDLYDYDVYQRPQPVINCPIGRWDIMAGGGLVHPVPILKEAPCTDWVEPVDLTTVLTPGVDATLTLPPAELVRDDSYYYLENDDRLGERYYFWSAGSGFDERMPGEGMLILHTDVGANPDALPQNQTNSTRVTYLIVQADGLRELEAGEGVDPACGDEGDPWPGSTDKRRFNFTTIPSATWYTQNAWIGLDILDVQPDGFGATQIRLNWVPTSIPSLRFVDPPGGVTVGSPPNATYNVRADANDVYGGTWIRFFYTTNETATPSPTTGTLISTIRKSTPGNHPVSANWVLKNASGNALPDGRYFLFADLAPGPGADGTERKFSVPRAGRNNQGTATLEVLNADVLTSTVSNGVVTSNGTARSETWVLRCTNATTGEWIVNSSLTYPAPAAGTPGPDPSPRATVGTKFTSVPGGVSFTLLAGTGPFLRGAVGDTYSFTTTGITALSEAVTIRGGQVREDPTAVIDATPLSGQPPLLVTFDARRSIEPNGQPLQYRWTWGDGSQPETGTQKTHNFAQAGTFTVVLRATNPANGRFGESAVDIQVTNNSPNAVIRATPASGPAPLVVQFSGNQSSDIETSLDQLIYQWDFGDGTSANDQATPGVQRDVSHTYSQRTDGSLCSTASPCAFTATLTVTDSGGKTDTDSVAVRVGNTNPLASVSTTALSGPGPHTVTFNARNSTDAENDIIEVEWIWGDGTPNETYRAKIGKSPATDGSVPHSFALPAGTTTKTYNVRAILRDLDAAGVRKGGETNWPGVTVTVTTLAPGESDPRAIFCFVVGTACETNPPAIEAGGSISVDASRSFDNPPGGRIASYSWDWGDGTPFSTGVTQSHVYAAAGRFTITLTVTDGDTPAHTGRTQRTILISTEGGGPDDVNHAPVASFVVTPPEGFVDEPFDLDARASRNPDGDDLQFRWSFGDGVTTAFSSNARTSHTYTSAGTYVIRLTVRDALNASTDVIQTVRVLVEGQNRAPVALLATGLRSGPAPLTLTFDGRLSFDPDGDPLTFSWAFHQGDVLIDNLSGSVVTRVFDEPGEFTVTLTVTDGAGGQASIEPAIIRVTEPGAEPPPEPPPPRPTPEDPPDSAAGRPTPRMCGMGMLTGLLGSGLGLLLTLAARRRSA